MKLYIICILVLNLFFSNLMAEKPYHHLEDGTFRNPEGSPERDQILNGHIKFLMKREKKLKLIFLKTMLFQEQRC